MKTPRSLLALLLCVPAFAQQARAPAPLAVPAAYAKEHYTKREVRIPMRDGVELFAAVYSPKDAGAQGALAYPILLCRTPYNVGPYGPDAFKTTIGPSDLAMQAGFIVAYEDVRGCYMSGGEFEDMRPHLEGKTGKQTDESSDAWDTIDWLVKNVPGNNARVGMWGISYPGFYASAGMIDAHPQLVAVSPQAPIADWWYDDFHHNGAFFLPHAFNFLAGFGRPRPVPVTERHSNFSHGTPDGYEFFLHVGPLSEANQRWFHGEVGFWEQFVKHPNYDEFWAARNLQPHLQHVAPAVLTVGGWFDAEDLYGALHTYAAAEAHNPGISNKIVMGPWQHGGWSRVDGDRLGNVDFGAKTSLYYREKLELAFFERELKGKPGVEIAEATMFETGTNRWRTFDAWPPKGLEARCLRFEAGGKLSIEPREAPAPSEGGFDEFTSDPLHPVPFTESIAIGMTREYMTDDQRFASRRPDVQSWQTEVLTEDLTLAGPLDAQLWVSTDHTDCDWIVKLVDVFPADAKSPEWIDPSEKAGGYQMMVRSEVMRGRFRDGPSQPKAFEPGVPVQVRVPLQDVLHTFQKGHRVMVQVQSTWFPLVDRNPQVFLANMYESKESDCVKSVHRVWRASGKSSRVRFGLLR
ncbi:MAG: CocE/NonD family hydrolase [Planctomycetes bacterium]|nr:CocE/NonD family hydrolase [Planctomycetota bacterium]